MAEKPFTYDVRVTMADYRATITKYNNQPKRLTDYYVGQRVGEIWGYQVEGLFQSEDEIANSPSQANVPNTNRSEEHTSELQSLMRISYAVFCLKKKKHKPNNNYNQHE